MASQLARKQLRLAEGLQRIHLYWSHVANPAFSRADRPVPAGFVVHAESTTSILFASPQATGPAPVFLNPVQEYNRDLSIVAIRTWSEQRQKDRAVAWEKTVRKKWAKEKGKRKAVEESSEEAEPTKKLKAEDGAAVASGSGTAGEVEAADKVSTSQKSARCHHLIDRKSVV